MKASELRIGNYLDFDGRICFIEAIDKQGVEVKFLDNGEEEWIDLFQFSPIQITEEWALKFGFEKKNNEVFIFHNLLLLNIWNKECEIYLGDRTFVMWMVWDLDIIQIHQLQNLYFALTGEELEIK